MKENSQLPRVVVTGLGAVTPLGNNVETTWQALLAGKSGIGPVTSFDTSAYPVHIGAEVKDFDPARFTHRRPPEAIGRGSQLAVAAAWMALGRSSSLWQWTMMSMSGPNASRASA